MLIPFYPDINKLNVESQGDFWHERAQLELNIAYSVTNRQVHLTDPIISRNNYKNHYNTTMKIVKTFVCNILVNYKK